MTYEALLGRLFQARRAGVVLGLDRVERCLAALGHPERAFAVRVHVGGTNGKGSTGAFVESMARAAGRRTGLFTSPHLSRFCERFRIHGRLATEAALVAAGERVHQAAGADALTFFEQVTVMALWLFADACVDTAILEVGVGGRLDATNAVPAEIAAVTGVALDHQDYLGATLAAIAREKAGIFKPGQRAVIGRAGEPEAVPMLVAGARAAGVSALTVIGEPVPAGWELGLPGAHQRDNAAAALAIARHLEALGLLEASETLCRRGLAAAWLPGRLETVAHEPHVLIDGAHNPHAARMLAARLAELPRPRVLVLAVCEDKDAAGVAGALAAQASAVVVTQVRSPRAMPAVKLAGIVAKEAPAVPCLAVASTEEALARARALAGPGGVVLAAGSLFLAGEVRQHLCGEPADVIEVSDPLGVRSGRTAAGP